jgi:hypothetical protein
MDDDLRALGALLDKPAPPAHVVDRGRRRIEKAAHGRPRHRGVVLGLAAAAIAVGLAVPGGPAARQDPGATPTAHVSGRQALLAAAVTAEHAPAGSGTYWHIKRTNRFEASGGHWRSRTTETWTRRDGHQWVALSTPGTVGELPGPQKFTLIELRLSFAEIQALPTDPAALTARLRTVAVRSQDPDASDHMEDEYVISALISLVQEAPAPPRVRGAAFRALAASPGVRSTGPVSGGQGYVLTGDGLVTQLTVDPSTARVWSSTYLPGHGRPLGRKIATSGVTAGWTNRLPRVVPLPPHFHE